MSRTKSHIHIVYALFCLLVAATGLFVGCAHTLRYPEAPRGDVTDCYHGTEVPDPFRWLEDPDSAETRAWIDAQVKLAFPWLHETPEREGIKKRLTELWNYEKYGTPFVEGGRYFFSKNDGLQNHSVYYWTDSLDDEPKVLIDPNKLSEDGTVSLGGVSISRDGKYLAYGLSSGGSDWRKWYVREIDTGRDLDDCLEWIKFSGASWNDSSSGFYYSRYEEPEEGEKHQQANYNQKVYFHKINTPQSEDVLVYERPEHKDRTLRARVTDDGEYLIISIGKGTERKNLISYKKLDTPESPVIELIGEFEASFGFVDNNGPVFWFKTDLDAPMSRVIAIDTSRENGKNRRTVIAEQKETLRRVNIVNNTFITSYLKDAHSLVKLFDIHGKLIGEIDLPGLGRASGFGGKRLDKETFYRFSTFDDPGTIYRLDMETGKRSVFRRPKVAFDLDRIVTKQVFYKSKDGTRVPMFIVHLKGLELNSENPTILCGYGGFNISQLPSFSTNTLVWMEMGGVHVMANIRGGGEYGEKWHQAGMKLNKQNCFDDFIAAAEWLIEKGYTSTDKLAIKGGSNGGLLVGACMTQRPDLFGACLPSRGVLDMLRFNRFTIGWAWVSDYGSPEDPEEFEALHAYSPYHNIHPGIVYPATLITTADHDDRVVPGHSFKFTACLQEAQAGDAPILIRIETKAGHGAGTPTTKRIDEAADIFAFLVRVLEM